MLRSRTLLKFLAPAMLAAWLGGAAADEQTAALEAKLKGAMVEPTLAGVQAYLESLVDQSPGKSIDELIEDLADSDFKVREAASTQLAALGTDARKKLQQAARSADPERAYRAKQLLLLMTRGEKSANAALKPALELVRLKKWPIKLPLLLTIRTQVARGDEQEAAMQAMLTIIAEEDRQFAKKLLEAGDPDGRNAGRRLLAALDAQQDAPLLEGAFEAVFVKQGGSAGGGPNILCGWEFEAKADLAVTHLGLLDRGENGLATAHEVAVWDVEDETGPVTQTTVPAGTEAALTGAFRYVDVPPVKLKAGRRYAIVAHFPNTEDMSVNMLNPPGLTITYADHVKVVGRRHSAPHKSMAFPQRLTEDPRHASFGPSFKYAVANEDLPEKR